MQAFVVEVYDQHTGRLEVQSLIYAQDVSWARKKFLDINPAINIQIRQKRLVITVLHN